jgi:hypothetical protein
VVDGEQVNGDFIFIATVSLGAFGEALEKVHRNFFHVLEGEAFGSVVIDEHVGAEVEKEDEVVALGLEMEGEESVGTVDGALEPIVPKVTAV